MVTFKKLIMFLNIMANTLDDVIKTCVYRHQLAITPATRNKYLAFLQRQLSRHPEYDLNFRAPRAKKNPYPTLNLMVDKLLLFSYLIGEIPIIAGYKDHAERRQIISANDLYLLRLTEIGHAGQSYATRGILRQTDRRLYDLAARFTNHKSRYGFHSWGEAIDELGQDEEVVRYFGQQITYAMVRNCKSPNPLTYNHGGYRYGRRKS